MNTRFRVKVFVHLLAAISAASLAMTAKADVPGIGGFVTLQGEDAHNMVGHARNIGVPPVAGPGGPVDLAIALDEVACAEDAATAKVSCQAKSEGESYYNDDDAKMRPVLALLIKAGNLPATTKSVRATNVQCYLNTLPNGSICALRIEP